MVHPCTQTEPRCLVSFRYWYLYKHCSLGAGNFYIHSIKMVSTYCFSPASVPFKYLPTTLSITGHAYERFSVNKIIWAPEDSIRTNYKRRLSFHLLSIDNSYTFEKAISTQSDKKLPFSLYCVLIFYGRVFVYLRSVFAGFLTDFLEQMMTFLISISKMQQFSKI